MRAEAYNALNHSNWGTPNRFVNTPQFGSITEATTPGREFHLSARLVILTVWRAKWRSRTMGAQRLPQIRAGALSPPSRGGE